MGAGVARGECVWAGGEAESEGRGIRHGDEGGRRGARQGNVRHRPEDKKLQSWFKQIAVKGKAQKLAKML